MKVHVQFFSRLRDLAGISEVEVEVAEGTRITDLLGTLYARTPSLRDWDKTILVAAGVEFAQRDYVLKAGDQISIMPPVQGG
ncbi:MAG TPA: MoaD/ThiS family protein [Chthoniobacterales bacterium]|nr:MoaD/ThiS family protein [Chthoniobacterales bacterium]